MTEKDKLMAKRIDEARGTDTQAEMATKINSNQGMVSKLINGSAGPSVSTLVAISNVYGVSVDWLLGISDCKNKDFIDCTHLTYGQAMMVMCQLFDLGIISEYEIPNGINPITEPTILDSKDPLFSYLLTRRYNTHGSGNDMYENWKETSLTSNFMDKELVCSDYWNETGRTPEERMRYNDDKGWLIEYAIVENISKNGFKSESEKFLDNNPGIVKGLETFATAVEISSKGKKTKR